MALVADFEADSISDRIDTPRVKTAFLKGIIEKRTTFPEITGAKYQL